MHDAPRLLDADLSGLLCGGESAGFSGTAMGLGSGSTGSSGLPSSQARLSKSAKTWQLPHAWSPWLEVWRA